MLRATLQFYPQHIDSRYLQMELEYFMLSKASLDALMVSFCRWCDDLINNQCITEWYWGKKTVNAEFILPRIIQSRAYTFGFEANIVSDVVYNKRSFRRLKKKLLYDGLLPAQDLGIADDYFRFFDHHFSIPPQSSEAWKMRLLKVFEEPGRKCISPSISSDIYGFGSACPYYSNTNFYHGSIRFCISAFCLYDDILELSDQMVSFLKIVSENHVNINGRVALSPILSPAPCSGHMIYFGGNVKQDRSHLKFGVNANEWYKYYYLCGVEWFNILSPLVMQHVPNLIKESNQYPSLIVTPLKGGGVAVKLRKRIDSVDVRDLLCPKLLLYNALYPGYMSISKDQMLHRDITGLIAKPRKRWELVPVLDDEIIILEDKIVFAHLRSREGDI